MTYRCEADRVTLEMAHDEFENLLLLVGTGAGIAMSCDDPRTFWQFVRLANDINTGNPAYTPYEIPPEYAGPPERVQ